MVGFGFEIYGFGVDAGHKSLMLRPESQVKLSRPKSQNPNVEAHNRSPRPVTNLELEIREHPTRNLRSDSALHMRTFDHS